MIPNPMANIRILSPDLVGVLETPMEEVAEFNKLRTPMEVVARISNLKDPTELRGGTNELKTRTELAQIIKEFKAPTELRGETNNLRTPMETAPIGLQHAVHSVTAGNKFQIILIHNEIVWSLDPRLLNMNCLDE